MAVLLKEIKGRNLKRLREEHNLKQWQIAEMINAKESNISEMERGKRTISDRVIDILCYKLHIEPYEFYITDETPILKDKQEAEHIYEYRKAEKLMIADKVDSYMSFIIKESSVKEKDGIENEKISNIN